MFTRWGEKVVKLRFAVIGIVGAALLALGGYGLGLEDHLSSSGWDDPTSESAQAARLSDEAFGRDHTSDVIVLYHAPPGKTIDDPEFSAKVIDSLNRLPAEHPDQITKVNGAYWATTTGPALQSTFGSKDKTSTFASIAIEGDNDTDMVRNYRAVKDVFEIPGVDVQVAGLQAVAGTLNDTMADDQMRMELLAIPAVAILLFFIFGGVVAAALPLIVGGLTVIGAWGIVRFITEFTDVNSFVSPVVSMIGLGLAIDYGLFIVSRFREEMAAGYDTPAAVRRSVMTAGRTVVFSATMIIASLGGMLLFPQGFLKSIAYGSIATVTLAALTAITVLPAMLAVLGRRVDMLGFKRFRKTKTAEEVENGFWGRCTRWVMQHPLKLAIPICILLLLLIIPVKNLAFGGINERYLPPDNSTRLAQADFDKIFPLRKSDPVQLIFVSDNTTAIGKVWEQAQKAPGLAGKFGIPARSNTDKSVYQTSTTLVDSDDAGPTLDYLRSLDVPDNVKMYVGGQPAIQKDSIDALLGRMPLMIALVLLVTTVLMFLTFGSLVLPIKAALMSALGLGSTLGILTWIFIDGHGAGLLNFTPQPIMSPVLVLIIAIIYGLSTDYEVFLLSRMVEARTQGASTTEAVRVGTAHTGRIITAAALILLVVTGAFAFSDLVMMQYIAYGMIAALFIDATILRMLLVPATMKLLGDDCWWAPAWMKRIQQKIGLGEPILDDERPGGGEVVDLVKTTPITDPVTMTMPALGDTEQRSRKRFRKPRTVAEIEAEAPTQHLRKLPPDAGRSPKQPPRRSAAQQDGPPARAPKQPTNLSSIPHDPTGPRPPRPARPPREAEDQVQQTVPQEQQGGAAAGDRPFSLDATGVDATPSVPAHTAFGRSELPGVAGSRRTSAPESGAAREAVSSEGVIGGATEYQAEQTDTSDEQPLSPLASAMLPRTEQAWEPAPTEPSETTPHANGFGDDRAGSHSAATDYAPTQNSGENASAREVPSNGVSGAHVAQPESPRRIPSVALPFGNLPRRPRTVHPAEPEPPTVREPADTVASTPAESPDRRDARAGQESIATQPGGFEQAPRQGRARHAPDSGTPTFGSHAFEPAATEPSGFDSTQSGFASYSGATEQQDAADISEPPAPRWSQTPTEPPSRQAGLSNGNAHHDISANGRSSDDESSNGVASAESETQQPETTDRNSIEDWMAQLRSARRGNGIVDSGRHSDSDSRTVSVNELLRRRDRE